MNDENGHDGKQGAALTPLAMVQITPNVRGAREIIAAFEELKSDLLKDEKYYADIKGKRAIKRAGFSLIAIAFGISTTVGEARRIRTPNDYQVYVVARASDRTGRYSEATGTCTLDELRKGGVPATIANVEAMAQTRATSRAIANHVGGGILSVEELSVKGEGTPVVQVFSGAQEPLTSPQLGKINREALRSKEAEILMMATLKRLGKKRQADLTKAEASDLIGKMMDMPSTVATVKAEM